MIRARLRAAGRHPVTRVAAWTLLAVAIGPVLLTAAPWVVGADEAYVVLTGSMVPTLDPGDIIFIHERDPAAIRAGDVISFHPQHGMKAVVTHRVIKVLDDDAGLRFVTQGDANEDPDPMPVVAELVVGVQRFHIPMWGTLLMLLHSRWGYLALVVVPGVALVGKEFVTLYRELDAWDRARKGRPYDALLAALEEQEREDARVSAWLVQLEGQMRAGVAA